MFWMALKKALRVVTSIDFLRKGAEWRDPGLTAAYVYDPANFPILGVSITFTKASMRGIFHGRFQMQPYTYITRHRYCVNTCVYIFTRVPKGMDAYMQTPAPL